MKNLPTLRQLQYLDALAHLASFSAAAESCHVTQSALSTGIKSLEDLLGTQLVDRTRRQAMLTDAGLSVLADARDVLTRTESLVDRAGLQRAPLSGSLRLGIIPTIAPFRLPRLLPALRKAFPKLKLSVREDMTAPLSARLAAGSLDVLLLALPCQTAGMETALIGHDSLHLAVPSKHPLHGTARLPDLQHETVLMLEDGHCLRDHAMTACQIPASSLSQEVEASSLGTLLEMVAEGYGVTLVPGMALDAGLKDSRRIRYLPFKSPEPLRQIGLAWRENAPRRAEYQILADFLKNIPTPQKKS
jgi:LysR family transcriptional regulator, hydrogen peroxide-inducible genes activator